LSSIYPHHPWLLCIKSLSYLRISQAKAFPSGKMMRGKVALSVVVVLVWFGSLWFASVVHICRLRLSAANIIANWTVNSFYCPLAAESDSNRVESRIWLGWSAAKLCFCFPTISGLARPQFVGRNSIFWPWQWGPQNEVVEIHTDWLGEIPQTWNATKYWIYLVIKTIVIL